MTFLNIGSQNKNQPFVIKRKSFIDLGIAEENQKWTCTHPEHLKSSDKIAKY